MHTESVERRYEDIIMSRIDVYYDLDARFFVFTGWIVQWQNSCFG